LRRRQNFGDLVPPFIGDNDTPHRPSAPPQGSLYPLRLTSCSTIVWQKMAALVLDPLTVLEMKKITWHIGTSRLPNERSVSSLRVRAPLDALGRVRRLTRRATLALVLTRTCQSEQFCTDPSRRREQREGTSEASLRPDATLMNAAECLLAGLP
jgi:hypothetical protein